MKLRKLAAAALAALLIPAAALGAVSNYQQLRPPGCAAGLLAATAGDSLTDVIRIFGAAQVDFLIRCAGAESDSLANCGVQVSNDGVNYIEIGKQTGLVKSGSGVGLIGKTGKHVIISPPTGALFIPWSFARLSLRTAGAQIDSVCVDAWVFDTMDSIANKNYYQPTVR